jgi:GT2 family glycosyltransferase
MTLDLPPTEGPPATAAVVIGRNEGQRLINCLASLQQQVQRVIYVDSGSTDGSADHARRAGAIVVSLDGGQPFTAARARNAGVDALRDADPDGAIRFVQFVDGDCRMVPGWIATATAFLSTAPTVAVVCGRRREIAPQASAYNGLCDMEWNTPVGEAGACGGDALMRRDALDSVGGFDDTLIAGEEPELCLRLLRQGWRIWRLDHDMTLHDAAMTRFGQWRQRTIRSGWAYAEGFDRYGSAPERYRRRELRSILFWGGIAPLGIVAAGAIASAGTPILGTFAVAIVIVYIPMALRIAVRRQRRFGDPWRDALRYGAFTMLGKFPQMVGVCRYYFRGREPAHVIEYKD